MKQSNFTGGYIAQEIKRQEEKRKELAEGLNQLEDAAMEGTAAYSVLKTEYDNAVGELRKLENVKYEVVEDTGGLF